MSLAQGRSIVATDWFTSMREGRCFAAENFILPAVGLFGLIQIFNPAGSATRVVVRSIASTLPAAIAPRVRRHDIALPTLGLPAPFIVENLLGGGPAEVAEMRSQAVTPVPSGPFWIMFAAVNDVTTYPTDGREDAHILLPGQGLLTNTLFVNSTNITMFLWSEEPL